MAQVRDISGASGRFVAIGEQLHRQGGIMKLESILGYLERYLGVSAHPDYRTALNGLQVEGPGTVSRIAAAVDASASSIREAARVEADLLLVHHGLFWGGLQPVVGPHFERIRLLIESGIALYSCHLPLDAHPEVGNCALLCRALGLEPAGRFGRYEGVEIGWWAGLEQPIGVAELRERTAAAVGGPVHVIPGGPERIGRVGVVTGGGASFTVEAAEAGLDALVTGEGPHHTHFDAMERGVHVLFGGHYATETFGVRALARHLAERFGVDWTFIDQPTGL